MGYASCLRFDVFTDLGVILTSVHPSVGYASCLRFDVFADVDMFLTSAHPAVGYAFGASQKPPRRGVSDTFPRLWRFAR